MVLSFFLSEENIMKLVFSKLRDNLFALNQLAIMISSEFIISIRWSRDLLDKNTFVSSANKMYLRSREVVDRSFMYSKNNNGPSIYKNFISSSKPTNIIFYIQTHHFTPNGDLWFSQHLADNWTYMYQFILIF